MKKISMLLTMLALLGNSLTLASTIPDTQFSLNGIPLGTTLVYFQQIYGAPAAQQDIAAPENIEGYQQLTVYRYGNKDSMLVLGTVTGSPAIQYMQTRSNNGWNPPSGITVGMKESQLKTIYGQPDKIEKGQNQQTYYYYNSTGSTYFMFDIKDHIITAISLAKAVSTPKKVYYTIPYTNGPVQISPATFTLHIGESIHIAPAPNSIDPGLVRFMGMDKDSFAILSTQALGKKDSRTSTELIITGKQVGTSYLKIVPNYGDWPRAASITIHVIP